MYDIIINISYAIMSVGCLLLIVECYYLFCKKIIETRTVIGKREMIFENKSSFIEGNDFYLKKPKIKEEKTVDIHYQLYLKYKVNMDMSLKVDKKTYNRINIKDKIQIKCNKSFLTGFYNQDSLKII